MAKLIRAGKVPCDLQGSDDGEEGTCYPFTVNMERRVSRNENRRSVSETGPKGKVIDFVFRKRVGVLCSLQMSSLRTAIRSATPSL